MNKYIKYCSGCGLCHSAIDKEMIVDDSGFLRPTKIDKEQLDFYKKVCLYNGKNVKEQKQNKFWGNYISCYEGFSNDNEIREKASTGGVITTICKYLLENKIVDRIIQVSVSSSNPFETKVNVNEKVDDVIKCSQSRYASSSPLYEIDKIIEKDKSYAIVPKPCAIIVLKNYIREYNTYDNIKYFISFFCAGTPSKNANYKLAKDMGIANIEDVKKINYRGDGWPGKYKIELSDGEKKEKPYIDAWCGWLGRDVQDVCRFCFDGIGEAADISCGDYWYIENNKPVFNEELGINVVFSWTSKGEELLQEMKNENEIELSEIKDMTRLNVCQPHHFNRRGTMYACVLAMRLLGKSVPRYNMKNLKSYRKNLPFSVRLKYFKGIISRVIKGKI